jgi:hypothetical protein
MIVPKIAGAARPRDQARAAPVWLKIKRMLCTGLQ